MRTLRKCSAAQLNTGVSKCPVDFGKMKGAILVEHGYKLPAGLSGESLEKLAHAATPERVYGIVTFVEYAHDGGEAQTSSNGYGGVRVTGYSDRTDTVTLDRFYPELHAAITKTVNKKWDVYFFDEDNILYGVNDGTDTLAGYEMNAVYSTATPHPTSSDQATMTVSFAFADAKASITKHDYLQLDFDPRKYTLGLLGVDLVQTDEKGTSYKLIEAVGGADLTSTYGALLAKNTSAFTGSPSAVTYNESDETLTITATGTVRLADPATLYEAGIKGLEQVA